MNNYFIRPNYTEYITSQEWRSLHPIFLEKSKYRCSMFPWIKCGKGKPYNCHHMNYDNLGCEELWKDVVVLSPFAHQWIIHGILSGVKRPRQQACYPNKWQKAAHLWCCTPVALRKSALLVMIAIASFTTSLIIATL